ncbi:phosphoribosyltransferase [Microbacterium sp. STN6]|uniref:phosphoribosyltransferase n=1 Tax=Microbacterium sp. STN6 TaxID=2995588 RepID=UPI002260887A|nr:phosphoribosyltransferase [Microbacterium sp. STN6]MCX7521126.1 phosphoribosyltransferase [Microbacterium sp. STN6]
MTFDVEDSGLDTLAEDDREVLGWLEFGEASRHLASAVVESGFEVDVVLAIARGGLLLAGAMAYSLGVKSCGALNVEFYTGVNERLPQPVLLPPMLEQSALTGKRVLLVDDVADSGRTLAMVVDLVSAGGAEVRTVCLYGKPQSAITPDFVWRRTSRWITFPWSALPPVQVAG